MLTVNQFSSEFGGSNPSSTTSLRVISYSTCCIHGERYAVNVLTGIGTRFDSLRVDQSSVYLERYLGRPVMSRPRRVTAWENAPIGRVPGYGRVSKTQLGRFNSCTSCQFRWNIRSCPKAATSTPNRRGKVRFLHRMPISIPSASRSLDVSLKRKRSRFDPDGRGHFSRLSFSTSLVERDRQP